MVNHHEPSHQFPHDSIGMFDHQCWPTEHGFSDAFPWIAKDFSVSLDQAQLLVSIYLLGFGPSQFIYGPMSDALGRKKVLLAGLLIAMSGLLMIIFWSHTFTGMVLGRFCKAWGQVAARCWLELLLATNLVGMSFPSRCLTLLWQRPSRR